MKQFIYATGYGTAAGNVTLVKDTTNGTHNLKLVRNAADGGNILYPIYAKEFSYVNAPGSEITATPQAMVKKFVIPAPSNRLYYTIIFTKKGKGFGEQSNWTFTKKANSNDTATTIGNAVVEWAEGNFSSLGLTITNSAGTLTITGPANGDDYNITGADELIGVEASTTTDARQAFLNAEQVKDLAAKCAADAGFNYTDDKDLYPNYLSNIPSSGQFKVYTLRFAEPRLMGTREEKVYQTVHVVFLSSATTTAFDTELKAFVEKSEE